MSAISLQSASGFAYGLFEFLESGKPVIHEWAKKQRLTVKDRAKLNVRFKRLRQVDFDLACKSLISGPIYKHVYKCVIHGDVMLRPLLCRGPIKPDSEYTLLQGAIERNWKLPAGAVEKAEDNRNEVIKFPTLRRQHKKIPLNAR